MFSPDNRILFWLNLKNYFLSAALFYFVLTKVSSGYCCNIPVPFVFYFFTSGPCRISIPGVFPLPLHTPAPSTLHRGCPESGLLCSLWCQLWQSEDKQLNGATRAGTWAELRTVQLLLMVAVVVWKTKGLSPRGQEHQECVCVCMCVGRCVWVFKNIYPLGTQQYKKVIVRSVSQNHHFDVKLHVTMADFNPLWWVWFIPSGALITRYRVQTVRFVTTICADRAIISGDAVIGVVIELRAP